MSPRCVAARFREAGPIWQRLDELGPSSRSAERVRQIATVLGASWLVLVAGVLVYDRGRWR